MAAKVYLEYLALAIAESLANLLPVAFSRLCQGSGVVTATMDEQGWFYVPVPRQRHVGVKQASSYPHGQRNTSSLDI